MPPQPNHTIGNYKAYKIHTDQFMRWLAGRAAATGYKDSSSNTTANLCTKHNAQKGKQLYETPKNVVPTRALLAQAQWIMEHSKGPVKVPADVQFSLQFAILLRKACVDYFGKLHSKSKEPKSFKVADENHQHFVAVLEKTRNILELPNTQEKTKADNVSSSTSKSTTENRFILLSIEETLLPTPESLLIPVPPSATLQEKPVQPTPTILRSDHYELEVDGVSESSLKIFCLFRDLSDHRRFLKETWETTYDPQSDLMVSSLITNLTLNLVDRAERNLMVPNAQGGQLHPYRETYISSSAKERPGDICDSQDLSDESLMRVMADDEFVYSSAYNSLFTAHNRDVFESLKGKPRYTLSTLRFVKETYDNILRHYKHPSKWSVIPSNPDWNDEDIFLKQMRLELYFRHPLATKSDALSKDSKNRLPFRDKLTEKLEDAYENVVLDISTIFSAQVLLDIRRTLGSRTLGAFEELRRRGAMAESAVGIKYSKVEGRNLSKSDMITDTRTLKRDWVGNNLLGIASEFITTVKFVIGDNLFIALKGYAMSKADELSTSEAANHQSFTENIDIHPSLDPAFWFNQQPIYCGMESWKLAVEQEKLGVKLVNLSTALLAAGYLYHACARLDLIDAGWVEMEVALEIHKDQFFKGEFPLKIESMLTRFKLNIGFKAQDFAKNKRRKVIQGISTPSQKEDHFMKLSQESLHVARYLEGKDTAEILIKNLCPQPKNRSGIQEEPRSNIEMLTQLREKLPAIIQRMNVNLITINRKSRRLLMQISERYKSELGIEIKNTDITPRMFVVMVMDTLNQASQVSKRSPQPKGEKLSVKEMYGPRLALAAEVITEMLPELNWEEQVQPLPAVSASAQRIIHKLFGNK